MSCLIVVRIIILLLSFQLLLIVTCAGRIWLDNVNCIAGDEILEDCNFNPWGINNCDHGDDVGVICRPSKCTLLSIFELLGSPFFVADGDNFLAPVENFTLSHVSATSITVRWNVSCYNH